MVAQRLPKPSVAGSNPVSRSKPSLLVPDASMSVSDWRAMTRNLQRSHLVLFVLFLLWVLGPAACMRAAPPQTKPDPQQTNRFQNAWDGAVRKLQYDEVVRAWGPPTSVRPDKNIRANWEWRHTLAPEHADISFGEGMELTFDAETKLLQDWKYIQWGPHPSSHTHVLPDGARY